jgi:hypothetical protein
MENYDENIYKQKYLKYKKKYLEEKIRQDGGGCIKWNDVIKLYETKNPSSKSTSSSYKNDPYTAKVLYKIDPYTAQILYSLFKLNKINDINKINNDKIVLYLKCIQTNIKDIYNLFNIKCKNKNILVSTAYKNNLECLNEIIFDNLKKYFTESKIEIMKSNNGSNTRTIFSLINIINIFDWGEYRDSAMLNISSALAKFRIQIDKIIQELNHINTYNIYSIVIDKDKDCSIGDSSKNIINIFMSYYDQFNTSLIDL